MTDIHVRDYSFAYALNPTQQALCHIDLTIHAGEILVLCGASGSGKTSLLRSFKKAVTPAGQASGGMDGLPGDEDIAIVFQNPETQLLTTTVLNDLAFQMENRGIDPFTMKKRMSETVSFFGLETMLYKPVHTLSGGQKQLVALCAAMMCLPKLLLLDEPTAQLDPLSCDAFLENVRKINETFGITVIMAEHRLEDCAAIADRIAFMANGHLRFVGGTAEALRYLYDNGHDVFVPPLPMASLSIDERVILTPKAFQAAYPALTHMPIAGEPARPEPQKHKKTPCKPALVLKDITAQYPDSDRPALRQLCLACAPGEHLFLLGGNGSGKSTLLKLIAGIIKPLMGTIKRNADTIGYMPQHVRHYCLHDRVADEMADYDEAVERWAARLNIAHLLDKHPYDLSGGEQQKAVFLAILSRRPSLLLLDEPTKGLDPPAKRVFAEILRETGATAVVATHDLEFAAKFADRCAMLFDGEIAYDGSPQAFFTGNRYYTTAVHKGLRHLDENAFLLRDVYALWGLEPSRP